jgi:mannose-1-phosphate guanylyltransferase
VEAGETIIPIVLSGGAGTRLWPESTLATPKQLLALTSERTMLQLTVDRVSSATYAPPIIVANAAHADIIETQLAEIGRDPRALLLEPAGRNTAPAIALAALAAGGGSAPLLVMPSDHEIRDDRAFHEAIRAALPLAAEGWLCAFGIAAERAETGYGWIEVGEELSRGAHRAGRFVEKPPREMAEQMLASGKYLWNGGIFLFRADAFLAALGAHAPDVLAAARTAIEQAKTEGKRVWPDASAVAASPSISIDYAVMEKAERVAVVPVTMGWSDIGNWDALYDIGAPDSDGNVLRGDIVAVDTANCLVRAPAGTEIGLLGVSDLIVVASGDRLLIMKRGRSQEVKDVVERMRR